MPDLPEDDGTEDQHHQSAEHDGGGEPLVGKPATFGLEEQTHPRHPDQGVERHPGQQQSSMWNGKHGKRNQPQRVLGTPHLVHQQEARHREKGQLGHAGSVRRENSDRGHRRDHGDRETHRQRVQITDVPCETSRVGHDPVDGVGVRGPIAVESEELPPPRRVRDQDRQVDRQPGADRRRSRDPELADSPAAQTERTQHHQQECGIQLRGRAEPDEQAGHPELLPRPGQQGHRDGRGGDGVEVGERVDDDKGGQRHQPYRPHAGSRGEGRRPDGHEPERRQRQGGDGEEQHDVERAGDTPVGLGPDPALRQLRRAVHEHPGDDRILHVPLDGLAFGALLEPEVAVGQRSPVEAFRPEQADHVGVAEVGELALIVPVESHLGARAVGPGVGRRLLQAPGLAEPAERESAQREREQHSQRSQMPAASDDGVCPDRPADERTRFSHQTVRARREDARVIDALIDREGGRAVPDGFGAARCGVGRRVRVSRWAVQGLLRHRHRRRHRRRLGSPRRARG